MLTKIEKKIFKNQPTIQAMNRTYKSKLLNPNITDCVILEEESYLQQSSLCPIYTIMEENQVKRSTLANAVSIIMIENYILMLLNKTKDQSNMKQVYAMKLQKNDYDEWLILTNHYEPKKGGDVVAIQHKITKCILTYEIRIIINLTEDDYWIIEIINDSKQINKLHGPKNKAVLKGHIEVCVTQQPGYDIWVVEDTF